MTHSIVKVGMAVGVVVVLATGAGAQPRLDTQVKTAVAVLCPLSTTAKLLIPAVPAGWTQETSSSVSVSLALNIYSLQGTKTPQGPPGAEIKSGAMVCNYHGSLGATPISFQLIQLLGGKTCTVRADKQGFDCLPAKQ